MSEESNAFDLAPFATRLKEIREMQARQRFTQAHEKIRELTADVDAIESDEVGVRELRATVYAEYALFNQRINDARSAIEYYEKAEEIGRSLPLDDPTGRYRLQLATTLINAAGLLAREKQIDAGLERSDAALELLEGLPEKLQQTGQLLKLGALQNKSSVLLEARQFENAEATLGQAFDIGEAMVTAGTTQMLPQILDIGARLSMVLRNLKRPQEALPIAEKSARWAQAAYEGGAQNGPALYVKSQMQLVDLNFAIARFAVAEDHLWKAIETSNDGGTMIVGTGFYYSLLRQPAELLDKGDLPKDEVIDALDELLDRMRSVKAPDDLMEVLDARRAAIVEGAVESASQILSKYSGTQLPKQSPVAQLLPLLRSDVQWAKTRGDA